jgi:heme-degrading monooxygenase HmoA
MSLVRPGGLVTVQELTIVPGREEEFAARFEELDVLGVAADAAEGELLEALVLQDGSRFLVVTSWRSSAGIERWVASAARDQVRAALEPFYQRPAEVTGYSVRARHVSD